MKEFFRFGFWDLVGTMLGIAGLAAGGTIAVKIAAGGWALLGLIGAQILVAAGGFSLRAYFFNRKFPFSGVEHRVSLRFEKQTGAGAPVVRAKLQRRTSFSARLPNITKYDRYQLIPDQAVPTPIDALSAMNHSASVEAAQGRWLRRRWYPLKAYTLRPHFQDMRPLRLVYDFAADMRQTATRYRIDESLDLPNDFSSPREFYTFEVSEPGRSRVFEFIFVGFQVHAARYYVRRGTSQGMPTDIKVTPTTGANPGSSFKVTIRSATVGAKIHFEWDWDGV